MNLLSDDTVNRLSEQVANRFTKVNEQLFTAIAMRIKEYGDLRGTELNDLDAMVRSGADLARIKQELARATNRSAADIDAIYRAAARGAYEFTRPYWEASGKAYIPFEDNKLMQDTVDGIIKQTAGEMRNISRTTCIALHGRNGVSVCDVGEAYKSTVDDCITALRMGVDYKSVINRATDSFARQGLTSVQYESGLHRRLDTAIRQNVIDGVAQINQHMLDACGEQFGADGVELSVHLTCAPDHLPIQGRQFSADDFDNLQMQLDFQDVRGNRYDAIKRPIGQWNCRHIAFPIIIGVSEPAHTDEELEEIAEKCTARVVIDGKPYTAYQATQLMRKLETKIRRQKDALNFAELCGNREVINEERLKLTRLQAQYNSISRQADLKPQYGRTGVYGKVSVANASESGIIDTEQDSYQSTATFMLSSRNDPLRDILGAATDSHPEEVAAFRKELLESGVEILESAEEALGYSPGVVPGKPGQIHISYGASYGAWRHEMQHFRDDRDAGWLGFRSMEDKSTRIYFERRAYAVEIAIAHSEGREDIVERLEVLLDEEIRRILGEFDGD